MQIEPSPCRRRPLRAAALALLGTLVPLLAASCGGSESSGAAPPASPATPATPATPAAPGAETPPAAPDAQAAAAPDAEPPAPEPARDGDEELARIVCTADQHDFGRVWQGDQVAHEFTFTAAGDTDLRIVDYRSDCGCTVAHLEVVNADGTREPYVKRTPVPSGTRFALAATFDTTNREGVQAKSVQVYANVPGGVLALGFRADIQPLLRVEPAVFVIDQMSVLERREAEFTVRGVTTEPFALTPLRAGLPDELEVAALPVEPGDDGRARAWRVEAVLQPGMPKGIRSYELQLLTDLVTDSAPLGPDGERTPFVAKARISAVIAGLVAAQPQNLNFGMVAADETVARTVTVTSHDPGFELPEPEVEVQPYKEGASDAIAETLHVTTRRAENGSDWEVELLLEGLADAVPRSFLGRVVIRTGHPQEGALEVVFSGLRRGR